MVEIDEIKLKRMLVMGLSVKEMAVIFECSTNTIRNRLNAPVSGEKTDADAIHNEGIRLLCTAIIKQAVTDLRKRKDKHDPFFSTAWCENLLDGAGIGVPGTEIEKEIQNGKRKDSGKPDCD